MAIRISAVSILVIASCSSSTREAASPAPATPTPVTYLALDSTTDWHYSSPLSSVKLSTDNGWKFWTYRTDEDTLVFVIERPSASQSDKLGDRWEFGVRTPNGKPFETKRYDSERSLYFGHGNSGAHFGGWYIVHESDIEVDKSAMRHLSWKVNRFSADIVLTDMEGSTIYARIRYNASIDPQPSPADVRLALYGKTVAERMEAGFEPFRHEALAHELELFKHEHGRPPRSQEEFIEQLHWVRLPELPEGKELWFDVPNQQLYIRPIGKEPPPATPKK